MSSSAAAVKVALVLGLQLLQSCWQHIGSCNSTNPLFAPSLCSSLCASMCSSLLCFSSTVCSSNVCGHQTAFPAWSAALCLHTTHTMCTTFLQSKQRAHELPTKHSWSLEKLMHGWRVATRLHSHWQMSDKLEETPRQQLITVQQKHKFEWNWWSARRQTTGNS